MSVVDSTAGQPSGDLDPLLQQQINQAAGAHTQKGGMQGDAAGHKEVLAVSEWLL